VAPSGRAWISSDVVKDAKGDTGGGNVRDYVELKLKGEKAAEITKRPSLTTPASPWPPGLIL
jgi:hypothetical protein